MAENEESAGVEEGAETRWDDLDPELLELAEPRRRRSILRPLLFVAVVWFGASIIGDWRAELAYFVSPSEPIEVTAVQDFPDRRADDPGWEPELKHNRYVSVRGIPTRRAESPRYRFFKLIGGDVFVEVRLAGETDPYEELRDQQPDPTRNDRSYFNGEGRALRLSEVSERYNGVRAFYLKKYNTRLCGGSEEFQREAAKRVSECTDGWLIQADRSPKSFWWYAALAGLIGVFIVLNIYWMGRWVYDFVRS